MNKRILKLDNFSKIMIFLCFLTLTISGVTAQTSPSAQSKITVPSVLSGCARDTIVVELTNLTGPACTSSGSPLLATYTVNIPGGAEVSYATGSLSSLPAGASFVSYASKVLTFTVPLPSLGSTTKVKFVVHPTCNVTNIAPLPDFSISVAYPAGVTPSSESWKSTKLNLGVAQLGINNYSWHTAPNATVSFNSILGSYLNVENTGFGNITEIEYTYELDDSIYFWYEPQNGYPIEQHQILLYSYGPGYTPTYVTGDWLATPLNPSKPYNTVTSKSIVNGKRRYTTTLKAAAFGPDGTFNPGDHLYFAQYYRAPTTCVRDQVNKTWVSYKCAAGGNSCIKVDTFYNTIKINAGTPIMSAANKVIDTFNGCPNRNAKWTFKNTGVGVTGRPEVSTAHDVNMGITVGGKMNFNNITLKNGTTNISLTGITPTSLNGVSGFMLNFKDKFTTDPDGTGGLQDIDGDGFYDELRPGDSLILEFKWTVDCNLACGVALNYDMTASATFTDFCKKLNGSTNTSLYQFGFKQEQPISQVTPLPHYGGISGFPLSAGTIVTRTADFTFKYSKVNVNTASAIMKLRINYAKDMQVTNPIILNGVTIPLSSFTQIGSGSLDNTASPGMTNKNTDSDVGIEYTLSASDITLLFNGSTSTLKYDMTHVTCDSFQATGLAKNNWQLLFQLNSTPCSGPTAQCQLDLACKQGFSYNIVEGCGDKPCYVLTDTLYRIAKKGYTSVDETTAFTAASTKFYQGDTMRKIFYAQLSSNYPRMEPIGAAMSDGTTSTNSMYYKLLEYFSFSYDKIPGVPLNTSPIEIVLSKSFVKVWDTVTNTFIANLPLEIGDFYSSGGIANTVSQANPLVLDDLTTGYIPGPGLMQNYCATNSWTVDGAKCPYQSVRYYYQGNSGIAPNYAIGINKADNRVTENYYYSIENTLIRAGYNFDPGYRRYKFITDLQYVIKEDFPQTNNGDFLFMAGIQRYGDAKSPLPGTFMSICAGYATSTGTIVTKEISVQDPKGSYGNCGMNVCNKLYFKSFGGNYFTGGEVRVPYKLDSVTLDLPTEYNIPGTVAYTGQATGNATKTVTGNHVKLTSNSALVTPSTYTDFPRMDDADGNTTVHNLCYTLAVTTSNGNTDNYKVPVRYYLRDEWNRQILRIDTIFINEGVPNLTISPISSTLSVNDGGSCQNFYIDYLVANNTLYPAANSFFAARSTVSSTVTRIVDHPTSNAADKIDQSVDVTTWGGTHKRAILGTLSPAEQRIVRVYYSGAACSDALKVYADWGCTLPSYSGPYNPLAGPTPTLDSSVANMVATSPYILTGPVGGNITVTDLCSQPEIEVKIVNGKFGNIFNLRAGFKLPAGVEFVAGSAQNKTVPLKKTLPTNPAPTYRNVLSANVTTVGTDSVLINIGADTMFNKGYCGLPGVDSTAFNAVYVKFSVKFTTCASGASNAVNYRAYGNNFCGTSAGTNGVVNLLYIGTSSTASYSCKPLPNSFVTVCAVKGQTIKIKDDLYIKNTGTSASSTSDTMEITVGQDTSRFTLSNFTAGSPWSSPIVTTNAQGRKVVKLVVPAGLAVNDSFMLPLSYDITPKVDDVCNNPSIGCADISHSISFFSVPVLNCPANGITGCSGVGRVTKGTGFVPRDIQCCAALGNYVWLDDDKDGIQDAGEQGVAGVTVTLFDATGKVVASAVTDAYGKYLFTGLTPGSYSVQFTEPPNYTFTTQTNGTTDGSDVNPTTGRTASVTLASGETNLNLDAGLIQAAPIGQNVGDYVWLDTDKDGIQDAGEDGIAGVTVTLYDAAGKAIATTVTDGTGKYNFPNVPAGSYTVGFTPPIGLVGTTQTSGTATGSDMSASTFKTAPFTVTAGTDRTDIDAGFYPQDDAKAALGNLVWNDLDNDGTQDAGEPGVEGVTVTLYNSGGTAIGTTKTDAFGQYIFNDLAPGTYSVGFSNFPTGYALSPQNTGGTPADSMDSDANTGTGRTGNYTLVAGERNMSVDAGIFKSGANYTLGNYVWLDADKDGIQDAAEAGVAGVMVILKDASGNPLDTTYTDKDGKYLFTNLAAGSYSVQVKNIPSGLNITTKDQTAGGGTDANDSDADPSGSTAQVTLGPGNPNDMTLDIGLQPAPSSTYTASLGNRIWFDGDADGIQDAQEPGLSGVKVYLYAANGTTKLDSTYTDGKGEYMFTGLPAGDYVVGAVLPSGYNVSAAGAGTDPAADNNGNAPVGGISKSNKVSLANGEENLTIDFGINKPSALIVGNKVWLDADKDGVQDVGEAGVPNIGVRLLDAYGNVVGTTVTDADGNYLFVDVPAGNDYTIQFTNLPTGYVFTAKDSSSATDITDSDASKVNGITNRFNVTAGYTWTTNDALPQLSHDAGIYPATVAAVKGTYWVDANKDGIQDPTEAGIPGMRVTLYDNAGNPVGSTITDANGNYLFPNVTPGNGYTVGFEAPPSGSTLTTQNASGSTSANNSDASPTTLRTAPFNLAAGEVKPDLDAGIITPITGSLGDKIWLDRDQDGQQDASEPGVPGVVLELLDNTGNVIGTTVTDANGNYLFSNLAAGNYKVRIADIPGKMDLTGANLGPDATDSDFDAVSKTTGTIALAEGENRRDIDGGLIQGKAQLGNYVWLDDDKDGIQDAGEQPVAGVTVTLFDATGKVVASTVTDAYGKYIFKDLDPGAYTVQFTPPSNYEFTTQTNGTLDGSDVNPLSGISASVTLAAGDSNMSVDAGLIQSVPLGQNVGDYVWFDTDKDGVQDAGETGIAGVTVTLYDNTGKVIGTTVTDKDGKYNFASVPAGTYTVGFTPPIGLIGTSQTSGNTTGSDMSPTTFKTAAFTVTAGTDRTDIDAGFYAQPNTTASLGNLVWNDLDNDGVQDAGEPGVAGVTVTLYNSGGTAIATTVTDAFGNYVFNNLAPATYSVGFTGIPSGFSLVSANAGGTPSDSMDSDANTGTGRTGNYTLAAGEKNMTVDAGIYSATNPYTLGNFVWLDTDKDGVQDAGEAGVAGVMVILRNSSGTPIDTTYTDKDGQYLFTNLAAGAYSVQVKNYPSGLGISPKDVTSGGGTDATDSDADGSGTTATVTLGSGNPNDRSLDIGLMPSPGNSYTASLGNRLWFDGDNDGIQDAGEPGLPGVKVYLYGPDGTTKLDSTVTDGKGEYIFTGLPPNDYYVGVKMPTGYTTTTKGAGSDPAADNNANTAVGGISKSDKISLSQGEENLTIDFGINKAGALIVGDKVWLDADKDGVDDNNASEPGVSGIGVRLLDSTGRVVATTVTDANGNYLFVDVPLGKYQVQFTNLPSGYVFTTKDTSTANDQTDSDPNRTSGKTDLFTVTSAYTWTTNPASTQRSYDAGIYPATVASVAGTYWVDANGDGIQDPTEKGIPGMRVTLYDNAGNPVASTITDANGNYLFPNVTPGAGYTIGFEAPPTGTTITTQNASSSNSANNSEVDPTTRKTVPFNVAAGDIKTDIDAGVKTIIPGSIGDRIWLDINYDGQQNASEDGVPGVVLQLLDASGNVIATTVTDANGNYLFSNLPPGDYKVRILEVPTGLMMTRANTGADATDSDFDRMLKTTTTITLGTGQNIRDIDGGLAPVSTAALGSYVWLDNDIDGLADGSPAEPGLAGVKVYLYDMATNTIVDSMTTPASGIYVFDSLPPGNYRVRFTAPGYKPTYSNVNSNLRDTWDSDADATGLTGSYPIALNQQNFTVWAGMVPAAIPLSQDGLQLVGKLVNSFVYLNWKAAADESTLANYQIMKNYNNGSWSSITITKPTSQSSYTKIDDLTLLPAGRYNYQLIHNLQSGEKRSNIVQIDYLKGQNRAISIVPNPSSGNFNLLLSNWEEGTATITLIAQDGRVINRQQTSSNLVSVNGNGLSEGIYNVKIEKNGIVVTEKVVITR